ncbi:preprotein translocase subunit YajC [Nitrosospira sp. NpAV]|uniref:preprotein translocase subunit YajC n=1 Tax=Nitrosospira sp. NpAV TaxID=58133 RepID=UPI0005A29676|nr:preprotein translocase subunit YajC [Nitrosospira sp. NpAV]KIO49312.1 preprotein translocase subunit YajC [Nitrosospira sp. NpAV]
MLINEAFAQAAASAPTGADFMSLLPLIGIFAVFYLLLIRPQAKRAKEQKLMIEALQKGDEVATTGGQLGRVSKVSGNYVILQIAENVQIVIQKAAIQTLLPKGTLNSIEKE